MRADGEVVEADDLHVAGHAPPGVVQRGEHADGHLVGDREDRVEVEAAGERVAHGGARGGHVQPVDRQDQGVVRGHPRGGVRVAPALRPLVGEAAVRGAGRPAHHRDPAGAAVQQVRHGEPSAGDVAEGHVVERRRHRLLAQQDERQVRVQPGDVRGFQAHRAEQHAVVLLQACR